MIGKFCGLSAPQLILSDVPVDKVHSMFEVFSNGANTELLKFLIVEFEKLKDVINLPWQYDFVDAIESDNYNQYRKAKRFFETGKGITPKMTKEEVEKLTPYYEEKFENRDGVILLNEVEVNGETISLSPEAISIIEEILSRDYLVRLYQESIRIDSYSEVKVMDRPLFLQMFAKSVTLRNNAFKLVDRTDPTMSLNQLAQDYKTLSMNLKEVVSANTDNILDTLSIANSRTLEEFTELRTRLERFGVCINDVATLDAIETLYNAGSSLMKDYNDLFGFNLSESELQKVFTELEKVGLFGLNIYFEQFFETSMRVLSFTKRKPNIIEVDTDLHEFTYELGYLLRNVRTRGKVINE